MPPVLKPADSEIQQSSLFPLVLLNARYPGDPWNPLSVTVYPSNEGLDPKFGFSSRMPVALATRMAWGATYPPESPVPEWLDPRAVMDTVPLSTRLPVT